MSSPSAPAAQLARGAAVLLAGRVVGRGLAFAVQLALARLLGPASYGLFAIGWTLFQLLGLASTGGLEHGVTRYGAPLRTEPRRFARLARLGLELSGLTGAVAALALFLAAPTLAEAVFGEPGLVPVLRVFAGGLLVAPALKVTAAACRAVLAMRQSVLAEDLLQPVVQVALVASFYALGWGVVGASFATVLSFAAALAAACWLLSRRVAGGGGESADPGVRAGELLAFSLPISLAGLISPAGQWVDRLLVGHFLSSEATGIYQSATQIGLLFVMVVISLNQVVGPLVADGFRRGAKAEVAEVFRVATRWGTYACLPAFLVVVLEPKLVLTVLFDERYAAGAAPLAVLALGQLFNLATGAVGLVLIMGGRQRAWLAICAAGLALNAVACYLLAPRFGLVGAAASTSSALVLVFGAGVVHLGRREGIWPWNRSSLRGVVAAAVATGALFAVGQLTIASTQLRFLVVCVAAEAAFLGTLALLGFDAEDREVAAMVRGKLGRIAGGVDATAAQRR